jgi:hypothetical protein
MAGRPIRLAVLGGVAVLALTAGCARHAGGNGSGALGTNPTAGSPAATASSDPGLGGGGTPTATPTGTPATTPAATPTHTPTPAPATHAYPADYAGAVLAAWAARDSAYLTLLTSSATAHTVLGYGNINTHWTLIRDDGAAGSTYASYYNNGGDEVVLRLTNDEIAAHHWHAATVQSWDVMTFPGTATAYARKYVDGWIAGNREPGLRAAPAVRRRGRGRGRVHRHRRGQLAHHPHRRPGSPARHRRLRHRLLVLWPLTLAGFVSYRGGGVSVCLAVGLRMPRRWCIAPRGWVCG